MKKISYILLFAAFSAQAQKLSTEITVERTVVPAERAATRLNSVSPSIVPATVQDTRIDMAEYGQPGTLTRSSYLLAPAAWADTFALSPYRGYVSAGYFPVYNLGVSAGYRLLQPSVWVSGGSSTVMPTTAKSMRRMAKRPTLKIIVLQ